MRLEHKVLSAAKAGAAAAKAYIFLYPLVFMGAFRQAWGEKSNTFARLTPLQARSLDGPAHRHTLSYVLGAWLDLSAGPVVVSAPDTRGRHVIATARDAWGEHVASFGSRQDGGKGGRYVFAGPSSAGVAGLGDFNPIRVGTDHVWIGANIVARSESDFDVVRSFASKFRADALGEARAPAAFMPRLGRTPSPLMRVTSMREEHFFTTAADLLRENPIGHVDAASLEALHTLGIHAGIPFSLSAFAPDVAQSIQEGAAVGRADIFAKHDLLMRHVRESWENSRFSAGAGNSNLARAARIRLAPHTAPLEEQLVLRTSRDSSREFLHGARHYSVRFKAGSLPPAGVQWSLSAVDIAGRTSSRKPGRSIGKHRELHYAPDGSLTIHIESTKSRRSAPGRNWLQCPQGRFSLALELLAPQPDALDGAWRPPIIERAARTRAIRHPANASAAGWLDSSMRDLNLSQKVRSTQ